MTHDASIALAGEYALGLMDAANALAFEKRLAEDVILRGHVARWREDLAGLADALPEIDPPITVLPAINARLFGKGAKVAWWRRNNPFEAIIGASAAAFFAFAVFFVTGFDRNAVRPNLSTTMAGEESALEMRASYNPQSGNIRIDEVSGTVPEGMVLQLWLIAGTADPVSLGVLPFDPQQTFLVPPDLRNQVANGVLAISAEPPGGSPDATPTGKVLATGRLSPVE